MDKQEQIKLLEQQLKHATDPILKRSISDKLAAIKNNKEITK